MKTSETGNLYMPYSLFVRQMFPHEKKMCPIGLTKHLPQSRLEDSMSN